jgi:hypothetical protein
VATDPSLDGVSTDPTFRLIGSPRRWDRSAALTSTLHWFETELLTREENLVGLMAVNRDVIGQAETLDRSDSVVLDMDSSESPVHGRLLGREAAPGERLQRGRLGGSTRARDRPPAGEGLRVAFRADAAFARPAIYEALEARGVGYAIRIPANKHLELAIEDLLFRSPGRPSRTPLVRYKSFHYQADSSTTPRRIVVKVEHHVGELFRRVGFIVTNLPLSNRAVVRFYNRRGTAEQWIKEGKQAAHWTRLSCHRFRANEIRLQLSVLRQANSSVLNRPIRHLAVVPKLTLPPVALAVESPLSGCLAPQTAQRPAVAASRPFCGIEGVALSYWETLRD